MLTLYTAIGHLKLKRNTNGTTVPVIVNGLQEYGMCEQEILLWSCLAFQILTIHELAAAYEARTKQTEAAKGFPFYHYLNRLLLRGLIAKGEGITAIDALYRLLGELQIQPLEDRFMVRLFTCIHLCMESKIKARDFGKYLKKEKFTPIEKTVLEMARAVPLTTAELVTCVDKGKPVKNTADVMDALYTDADTTYQSLAEDIQIHHTQYPVLQAIGNLYLNKQISFQQI